MTATNQCEYHKISSCQTQTMPRTSISSCLLSIFFLINLTLTSFKIWQEASQTLALSHYFCLIITKRLLLHKGGKVVWQDLNGTIKTVFLLLSFVTIRGRGQSKDIKNYRQRRGRLALFFFMYFFSLSFWLKPWRCSYRQ